MSNDISFIITSDYSSESTVSFQERCVMEIGDKKIPVGILGATGMVGQKFIELLIHHPWFELTALAASEKSEGKKYADAAQWMMPAPLPNCIAEMQVQSCRPNLPCRIVFSGLDSSVAGEIERKFALAGYTVISNSSSHRMQANVPLIIPEVNSAHLDLIKYQKSFKGTIVTNPNCSVIGLATAFKPLIDRWGIEESHVFTMQAISGAGYPGIAGLDIIDNVIPYISGEEEKVESEPLKILGSLGENAIIPYSMRLSAQCNRVAVMDGHMACVSVKLKHNIEEHQIIEAWESFTGEPQRLKLPSAPEKPLIYHPCDYHPQPKLHRHLHQGMAISIGRLRKCSLLDWKFVILSHNTVRGAAGCAILNAELMVKKGLSSFSNSGSFG